MLALLCLCAPGASAQQARLRAPFEVSFDELWLRELPWASDFSSILETVEGTAVSDRFSLAGLSAAEPARLGIHASSWTELQHRFAGLDLSDPARLGLPLLLLPRAALRGAQLENAALGETSGGPGAILDLEPLAPSARWQGRLGFLGAPSGLQTDVATGSAPAIARLREAFELQAAASGPLRGERLGASFAFEWERADRSERGSDALLRSERKSALGQLLFAPNPTQQARLLLAGHDASGSLPDQGLLAGLAWLRRGDGGARLEAGLLFASRSSDPPPDAPALRPLERLSAVPLDAATDTGGVRVLRGHAALSLRERSTGRLRHAPRASLQLEGSRFSSDAGAPFVAAETLDGKAARAWSWSAAAESRRSLSRIGLAVADRMSVPERLEALLGLRFDAQSGSSASWSDVSPHASLQLRPLRGLPLVLHGGFAQYAGRLSLPLLAYGDPAARSADVYRWSDPNRDGLFQPGERGPLVARAGQGGAVASIDPELAAPRTTEYTAGFTLDRGPLRFGFAGIHRTTRRIAETVNVGVPASSYRVRLVPDTGVDLAGTDDDQLLRVYDRDPATFGQDRFVLQSPEDHEVTHEGVELALELQPAEQLRLRLSATASKTTGAGRNSGFHADENDPGLPGALHDDPNADSFASGRMFFDRAYTLKLAGVWRRGGWGAGFAARYSDGQPFARVVVAEGLQQGPEMVAAVERGDHRFTYILTVDARLARDVSLGRAHATLSLEAFSLFRQKTEVEEYVVSGPAFRTVTATQPPRALRLGLTLGF